MSARSRAFPLQPLLEERRRIEDARSRAWIEIESERNQTLARLQLLERAAAAAHVASDCELAARAVATEWHRTRARGNLAAALDRLHECSERRNAVLAALRAARLDRRIVEKLEERWQAVRRRRHARREAAAVEEAAMLSRARSLENGHSSTVRTR